MCEWRAATAEPFAHIIYRGSVFRRTTRNSLLAIYWLAAESEVACGDDGVWNMAGVGTGFSAIGGGPGAPWTPGGEGAVPATIVWGIPPVE